MSSASWVRCGLAPGTRGAVEALELQHYEPLTLPAMRDLANGALQRWELDGLLVIPSHRADASGRSYRAGRGWPLAIGAMPFAAADFRDGPPEK